MPQLPTCAARVFAAFALIGASCLAAEPPTPRRLLTPDDYYNVKLVGDPQLSPDGQWVSYLVTTNDREADEARGTVWMVRFDGTQQWAVTNPAKGTHGARFSPDGRYLSYIATPAGTKTAQLLLLDRRGGEPRVVTHVTGDLGDYAWSPDGARIALVLDSTDAPAPKPTADAPDPPPTPLVIDALHFKQDEDGYLPSGHTRHLYLLDVQSEELKQLTQDAAYVDDLPTWSPDGARIALVRSHERNADPDGRVELALIDAAPDATARPLRRIYVPNALRLRFSPDGTLLAYLEGDEPRYNQYALDHLRVVPLAGGAPRDLTMSLDRAVISYEFTPDGAALTALVEDDGVSYPARMALADGRITALAKGADLLSGLAQAGGHSVVLRAAQAAPTEVYALEAGALRALSKQNAAWLAQVQLGSVEDVAFTSRDGTEVHGSIVRPPDFAAGKKYPAIAWLHGGPNSQDFHALLLDDNSFRRQLLAARGFIVLAVNYRGGSGRGSAYTKAILADWGHKDLEDVLAGVDHLAARAEVDRTRLGIGGWSYGGILTDYAIAKDTRFKAAFSGAGTANPLALYGSDEYIAQYNNELGPPWQNTARWLKLAYPLLHADKVHTPTLFMGGQQDFDVPINGGEQMYQALRTLGVPTQLIVYPGQYHTLSRPSFLKDRMQRVGDWFTRYLATP